ncbi:MAG TPA: recombinase RecF [Firmicutes bacterium]|jgi:predicted ATPase|nr:recombinase RecF [Bacillota bacterium]
MWLIDFFPQVEEGQAKMKLCRVSVDGFKNIKHSDIVFDGIAALISLNSYGKSNLLKAIDFGVDFIKNNEDTKKKMMRWSGGIPLNKATAFQDYWIEFEMITTMNDQPFRIIYGYQFRWVKDKETGACIIAEWLKLKVDEKSQKKYSILINRDEEKAFYRSSETGRCNANIAIDKNDLIINKLKAFDNLYYYEIIKEINALKIYIDHHLDASGYYAPDRLIRKDADILEIESINNLPRVIFNLKQQFQEKYDLLVNAYLQLFPQIKEIIVKQLEVPELKEKLPEDIPFKLSNEIYVLFVIDENLNQPISFQEMSDGAKRIFLLLTNIVLADINSITLLGIEEPENSIHPGLLQDYLRVLSQLLGDCRIIMTSHSPYIIQYLNLDDIYVGLPRQDGIAQFEVLPKAVQKRIIQEANHSDMSTGDYLFELLSGSVEEITSLENL